MKTKYKTIAKFKYGQWAVEIYKHPNLDTLSIECMGTWNCVNGICYGLDEAYTTGYGGCAYDTPEYLSKKLRILIDNKCKKYYGVIS